MATNKTLAKALDAVSSALGSLTKWPESDAQRTEANKAIRELKKVLKEGGYPDVIRYLLIVELIRGLHTETLYRDVKLSNFKASWTMVAELLD